MSDKLKRAIDRMVEDAIRRILPGVMNEVLVATIARGTSSIVSEERPTRPRKLPKKRKPVREARQPRRLAPAAKKRRGDLSDLLSLDESAGAEFYQDPRALQESQGYDEEEADEEPDEAPAARRIQALPPELRGLAEGLDLEDDGGEMWGEGEHDSGAHSAPQVGEIRNISEAAKHVGIDFGRMKSLIGKTSPAKRIDQEDVRANAQFEAARLKRMREKLNGGKPVE